MKLKKYIDINCDVGEGIGNEADIFPLISSCNIACGGHAGDLDTMAQVVCLAKKYQIKIGAHPSYSDKVNFGRVSLKMDTNELVVSIQQQIESLVGLCQTYNVSLHHIKPHGALYNDIAKNEGLAIVFLKSIEKYRQEVFLYVPFNSVVERIAKEQQFQIKREVFGDRNYNTDLSLVSRNNNNALITEPKLVLNHIVNIAKEGHVRTVSEDFIKILADTYCIHGDTPNVLQILTYLSKELPKHNIYIS